MWLGEQLGVLGERQPWSLVSAGRARAAGDGAWRSHEVTDAVRAAAAR